MPREVNPGSLMARQGMAFLALSQSRKLTGIVAGKVWVSKIWSGLYTSTGTWARGLNNTTQLGATTS